MKFENDVFNFIEELQQFDYCIDYQSHIWRVIFPDKKGKWYHVGVTQYQKCHYIGLADGDLPTLEMMSKRSVKVTSEFGRSAFNRYNDDYITLWSDLIAAARHWCKLVRKDWIKANKQVQEHYPLNRRFGYVPNVLVRASLPDIYRIDKDLGKTNTRKFIRLVESGYFYGDKNATRKSMTANDFFNYCKIAYIAGQRKDDRVDRSLSGREMYKRYADGRDEGLLEIKSDSEEEFAAWIDGKHPKRTIGGHPWEIKRGGNTTHIDLYVSRPLHYLKENACFKITLAGASISRLKETICMFLGLYDAGLPITIDNPEGIRSRLLAQDNIGIVPCYRSLHRANQEFSEEKMVFDVLYFDDLGRYKIRIKPFIVWDPLPVLKPKNVF